MFHPLQKISQMFLRGFPHLCAKMRRPLQKTKSGPEHKTHPNFQDTKSFVSLPIHEEKESGAITSVSTSPTNHDTGSDSNGRGFDTDTTNTGTNYGSGSDRGLNMSNLYGSSGGSDQGSNMYGSGGSDQGSNLYASGGSDQGSNLYGSGGSDQGSNLYGSSGENNSSNGDQDSNQDTSNDNSSDGTGSENGGDQTSGGEGGNMVSISGVVDGVEMKDRNKSSFPKPKPRNATSRISESDSNSPPRTNSSTSIRKDHRKKLSSRKPQAFSSQGRQLKAGTAAPTAKKARLTISSSSSCSSNAGSTSSNTGSSNSGNTSFSSSQKDQRKAVGPDSRR